MLNLTGLHLLHPGVTPELSGALCQAARVCMNRHHTSPTDLTIEVEATAHERELSWELPTPAECNAHANVADATRDGAYALSLLCLETTMGLVAVGRAEELTGADWYVIPSGQAVWDIFGFPDLDQPGVLRLEVSGQDRGPLGARLTEKLRQLQSGSSNLPGIAAIVGFERAWVKIAHYRDGKEESQ